MRSVAIVSTAMTQFGEREGWIRDLLAEAGTAVLESIAVDPSAIDHCYVSNMASGEFEGQGGTANALVHDLGLTPAYAHRVDQTSASGGAGLLDAWQSIASGASDLTLLVGGEKMTHRSTATATDVIASITHPFEYKHGVTLPTFAGLVARQYVEQYDAPRESLAKVAVKNHENGVDNPNAQFRTAIDIETALSAPMIADPLRLYDFCPISDGSAAAVLCPAAEADRYAEEYATIAGIGAATDTHVVHQRTDPTTMAAVAESGDQAYEMAGFGPDSIDVAELHDMFTILEFLQYEDLGFASKGEGWRAIEDGKTDRDGSLPVNTSGGLKAKGHPLGASGIAQVHEIYEQLLGNAGPRQVSADAGLACSVGGFGNCVTTTILEAAT